MDLDALVQKLKLECDPYMNKATQKYLFGIFLELAFRLYKRVDYGITMRNV